MSELIGREANRFDGRARADMAAAQNLAAAARGRSLDLARARPRRRPAASPSAAPSCSACGRPSSRTPSTAATPNTPGVETLGDPKGRFAVWAQRIDGPLKIESFEDEPGNPWADDDYYVEPLEAAGDVVLEPVLRQRRDDDHLHDGRSSATAGAVGVTGIDVALDALDKQTKAVEVLDSGYAFVAAPTGTLVAFPAHKGWTGKKTAEGHRRPRRGHARAGGLGRDQGPGRRPRRRHVLRAGQDRRLELRRRRAEGRDPGRRHRAAHQADPRRPARAAARRRRARVRRRPPRAARCARWPRPPSGSARATSTSPSKARTQDEVGRMAGAFGRMAESLRENADTAEAIAGRRPHARRDAALRARRARPRVRRHDRAPARDGRRGRGDRRHALAARPASWPRPPTRPGGPSTRSPARSATSPAAPSSQVRARRVRPRHRRRGRRRRRAPAPATPTARSRAAAHARDGRRGGHRRPRASATEAMDAVRASAHDAAATIRDARRALGADRRHRRHDHRHRRADQPARPERRDRGRPRRRAGPRLRRRRRGGPQARRGVPARRPARSPS